MSAGLRSVPDPRRVEAFERPPLNEAQQRIADSLREEGIAVFQFGDLFPDSLWRDVEGDIEPFVREGEAVIARAPAQPAEEADLLVRRFHGRTSAEGEGAAAMTAAKEKKDKKYSFPLDSPWLRVGASEAMLDVVNSYRGQFTKLYYADNWFTIPYPGSDTRIASQRWHRDPEEEHVVKAFLYLCDVDEGTGPFEYVKGSPSGGRYGELWKWGGGQRRPPDDEVSAAVAEEDRLALTGPAGTMILCDTGGVHRGGFARTRPRVMAVWTYISPEGKKGGRRRFRVDFGGREAAVSPQVRFALD
jgi:hypothetical protein